MGLNCITWFCLGWAELTCNRQGKWKESEWEREPGDNVIDVFQARDRCDISLCGRHSRTDCISPYTVNLYVWSYKSNRKQPNGITLPLLQMSVPLWSEASRFNGASKKLENQSETGAVTYLAWITKQISTNYWHSSHYSVIPLLTMYFSIH